MTSFFTYQFSYFILLTTLINIPYTSSAAGSVENTISLYNANDKVVVLTSQNFSTTVYQSKTAWLVEFYASWCGHCRSYADNYREIAIDVWAWRTIVRVGAINCYGSENRKLCREHGIAGYPKIHLIPPGVVFDNTSKIINLPVIDPKDVEKELIKELDNLPQRNRSWPRFTPANRATFEELYMRTPPTTKLLLIIVEKRQDFTGRQIMLDFSKYGAQLSIFRTTTDGLLWRRFRLKPTDIPALFVILRNRTAERIPLAQNISANAGSRNLLNHAIRSYIHKRKSLENFDDQDLEEIIASRKALKEAKAKQNEKTRRNKTLADDTMEKNRTPRPVNMIDLELALSHMFREEIPQKKEIKNHTYDALVDWLTVLTKYFPGREPVLAYLQKLLSKVIEQSDGFTGNAFRKMIDVKTATAYLPNHNYQYQHCEGSAPHYRGYPCALWLLFHTLTVSQYQQDSKQTNIMEIPLAIRNYMKHFFGCQDCSDHFIKETSDIKQMNLENKREAIIYLWRIHNHVNQRLSGDVTEDPKHPKVQFPSKYLCTTCQSASNGTYDTSKTVDFLLRYYSKKSIDTSLVLKSPPNVALRSLPERIFSKPGYSRKTIEQLGLFLFLSTTLQRYPLHISAALIVILILLRRRYCKSKRKRYTI